MGLGKGTLYDVLMLLLKQTYNVRELNERKATVNAECRKLSIGISKHPSPLLQLRLMVFCHVVSVCVIYQLLLLIGGRDLLLQVVQEALDGRHLSVQVIELGKGRHETFGLISPKLGQIQ